MIEIRRPFLFAVASLLILSAPPTEATAQVSTSDVDAIFAAFSGPNTPGCTVAVSEAGRPVLGRAYGMADLEHDVPNKLETVLEPGSVAKQFTAGFATGARSRESKAGRGPPGCTRIRTCWISSAARSR